MKQTCGPFSPGADPKVTANAAGEMDALRGPGVSCVFSGAAGETTTVQLMNLIMAKLRVTTQSGENGCFDNDTLGPNGGVHSRTCAPSKLPHDVPRSDSIHAESNQSPAEEGRGVTQPVLLTEGNTAFHRSLGGSQ